jgi:transaldolase
MADPLSTLTEAGVSIGLDDLSRERLTSGRLAARIKPQHVSGVRTNPSIFAKAIGSAHPYDAQIRDLAARGVAVMTALLDGMEQAQRAGHARTRLGSAASFFAGEQAATLTGQRQDAGGRHARNN